jgi:beta-mannosidase
MILFKPNFYSISLRMSTYFAIFNTVILVLFQSCNTEPKNIVEWESYFKWTLTRVGSNIAMPGTVPGNIHYDMINAGFIEDPFYRANEIDVEWMEEHDWVYATTFNLPESMHHRSQVEIEFKGIDTYSYVILNGDTILETNSMFFPWKANITNLVKKKNNKLFVYLKSPVEEKIPKRDSLPYALPTINDKKGKTGPLSRKAPYHFGWDWGPRLVTSGIWQPVILRAYYNEKIENFQVHPVKVSPEKAELKFLVEIWAESTSTRDLVINLDQIQIATSKVELTEGINQISFSYTLNNPKLWFPAGYGDQPLYSFIARLSDEDELIEEKTVLTGIRDVQWVQQPDSIGTSFYIRVNDIPIFSKGSNIIPGDNLLNRITPEYYENLVENVLAANMNMIRVWGGGVYENDYLYELCDQKGILVWQDFMFGNNLYWVDDEFYSLVEKEANYQVKRLRNHPSIVLWCGDNENEWIWKRGWNKQHDPNIWEDYKKINQQLLPKTVAQLDPERLYWRSSPSSGSDSLFPNDPNHGNIHDWRVHFGPPPFERYQELTPRFNSEFGHQSFPHWNTVLAYTNEEDRSVEFGEVNGIPNFLSEVLQLHNKQPWGNNTIRRYMDYYYGLPKDFREFVYISQLCHAEGMKTGVEHYRRSMPVTMGCLYWQFNDCYPVASWSGIDYFGRWKALQYFARDFYAPVMVSTLPDGNDVRYYITSDKTHDLRATLATTFLTFSGEILHSDTSHVTIPALSSQLSKTEQLTIPVDLVSTQTIVLAEIFDKDKNLIHSNITYLSKIKNLILPDARLSWEAKKTNDGIEITFTSTHLIKNIWLLDNELDGHFNKNFFDLLPNRKYTVSWKPAKDKKTTLKDFTDNFNYLSVNSVVFEK